MQAVFYEFKVTSVKLHGSNGCTVKFTSSLPEVALFLPDGGESREPSANIIDTVLTVLSIQRGESILYSSKWTRSLARTSLSPPRRATPFARNRRGGCQEHQGLYIAPHALSAHHRTQRIVSSVDLRISSTYTKPRACKREWLEEKFTNIY